jgi:hypothetical protein
LIYESQTAIKVCLGKIETPHHLLDLKSVRQRLAVVATKPKRERF